MIKVTYGTNTSKKDAIVDDETIVRDFLAGHEMTYNVTNGNTTDVTMSGKTLAARDLDKSFGELFERFGLNDRCYLISVKNVQNA